MSKIDIHNYLMYSLSFNMSKNLIPNGNGGEYRIRTDDPLRARQVL